MIQYFSLITEYQKKLKDAGVYTELCLMKGTIHGFIGFPGNSQ